MKIASFAVQGRRTFGVVNGDTVTDLGALLTKSDISLRAALASGQLNDLSSRQATAVSHPIRAIEWLPVVTDPEKIICVGVNYHTHRNETGRAESKHPALFLRLTNTLIGHGANLWRPKVATSLDYEGELALIIGRGGRYISEQDALSHVAGYTCFNDGSVREWQRHTHQFTPGKNFPRTGPLGPYMVTADEVPDVSKLRLTTRLNGTVMQDAGLDELIFPIPQLIAYCSAFTPLEPGDVICTGTPGGVGERRTPQVYMKPGDRIEVEISGIGTLSNGIEDDPS